MGKNKACKNCFKSKSSKSKDCCKCSKSNKCTHESKCDACTKCTYAKCQCKCTDQGYCATDIYEKYRDAVVRIFGIFSVTTSGYSTGPAPYTVPTVLYGNGFFIKGERIVCPSSVVLVPPSALQYGNRYPYATTSAASVPTEGAGRVLNSLVKVSRILVEIDNPEETERGCGEPIRTYTYEAQLVGVDGAGNIALLKIANDSPFNSCQPKLKRKKAYFSWGKSRSYCPGNKVFAIGDPYLPPNGVRSEIYTRGGSKNVILEGIVTDNNYVAHDGWALPPMLAVSFNVFTTRSGLPILDRWGRVIGMTTLNTPGAGAVITEQFPVAVGLVSLSQGATAGITQFFMSEVLKTLIRYAGIRNSPRLALQQDLLGNYYAYVKGYLGIYYNIFKAWDYELNNQVENFNPQTGSLEAGPKCKQILGIKVVSIAGNTNLVDSGVLVPGATPLLGSPYPPLVDSPLLDTLNLQDVITYIGKCPLGDLDNQVAPVLLTWRAKPGKEIKIHYRTIASNYQEQLSVKVTPAAFPGLMDYPWYAVPTGQLNLPYSFPDPALPDNLFVPAF